MRGGERVKKDCIVVALQKEPGFINVGVFIGNTWSGYEKQTNKQTRLLHGFEKQMAFLAYSAWHLTGVIYVSFFSYCVS